MLKNFSVFQGGKFYNFDTKEKMEQCIKKIELEFKSGIRKSI